MTLNRLDDSHVPLIPPDNQRTTFSIDLLGRWICNTWDEVAANGGAPFDVVVIGAGMFGGYCADWLYRKSKLRVLVLDAGPFLVSTHLQNLPGIGLYAPDPIDPATDNGTARNVVWGMPWRGNTPFVGQAYCVGGKSLFWGGWCPTLLEDDLKQWPASSPALAQYLRDNYEKLQRQVGIRNSQGRIATDYIEGPLFDLLKAKVDAVIATGAVPNLDTSENAPLAVQGQPPASGLFPFDKYSSVLPLIEAVREAATQSDHDRRLFVVLNTHVIRLETANGSVTGIEASNNGVRKVLGIPSTCAVVLALGTIESTRLAMLSFPTNLMGRNLMVHIRDNIKVRIKRSALGGTALPRQLQVAAMLIRGSTTDGRFHLQVTASADTGSDPDPDHLLFSMIPDAEQVDELLAMETNDTISFWFRGVSEAKGDKITPIPSLDGSWINLSPFKSDEFGVSRAFVQIRPTTSEVRLADAMDAAVVALVKKLVGGDPANYQIVSKDRDPGGSTYHEAGTLWMGDDPAGSVTDGNGRFHHIANAYCADQSLFPTVGSVNPTLTGLTLARRVGEAIIARKVLNS